MPGKKETIKLGKLHTKIVVHKGALHRKLGVPEGEKIPEQKLKAAEHSSDPTERKEANLAETMKGWHHKKK